MWLDDLPLLCCPACGGGLNCRPEAGARYFPPGFDPQLMAWEGRLECADCGADYPILEGVACLTDLGPAWLTPLREMESRLALTLRTLEPRRWERGRAAAYDSQEQTVQAQMEALFAAAVDEIDFSRRPLILDVGAGPCRTTELFQRLGARTVVLDADLGQLRYLSFEGIDPANTPAYRYPDSGAQFYFKEPRRMQRYFTRVFGDVGDLPFPSGAFDVVFCRSVLHHLDDHARTMREMARVLKPGGRMVFCAEPIRSPLESEEDCYDHCVQREEGMNERVWPLARFLDPIRPFARNIVIKVWPNPPTRRLRRLVPVVAAWLARRIGPGARVSGWKLPCLHFVNASINIFAERDARPINRPGAAGELKDEQAADDLRELTELFRVAPGQIEEGVVDLPRKREVVGRIRRQLLARHAQSPTRRDLAQSQIHELDRGWLETVQHEGGVGRRMAREAACTLGMETGEKRDMLRLRVARVGPVPTRLAIWANGRKCPSVELASTSWVESRLPLFGLKEPVATIRLRAESPSSSFPGSNPPDSDQAADPEIIVAFVALETFED